MTTPRQAQNTLAGWWLARYAALADQRLSAEAKMLRNYADYHNRDTEGKRLKSGEAEDWRSDARVNLPRQKALALFALLCDVLFSGGKISFLLKPDEGFEGEPFDDAMGKMTSLIETQHELTRSEEEYARAFLSMAVYGWGWLKALVEPVERTVTREALAPGVSPALAAQMPLQMRRFIKVKESIDAPGVRFVPVWNMFWDIEARNLKAARVVIERSYVDAAGLLEYRRHPGAIPEALERAIREAAQRSGSAPGDEIGAVEPRLDELGITKRQTRLLECWGWMPRRLLAEQLEAVENRKAGVLEQFRQAGFDETDESDQVFGMVLVAGEELIAAMPAEPDDRPYFMAKAEEDLDSAVGRGAVDNVEEQTQLYCSLLRAIVDNTNLSANLIAFVKRSLLKQNFKKIVPGEVYDVSEEAKSASDAVSFPQIPDVSKAAYDLLALTKQHADEDSAIPAIQAGMAGVGDATATEVAVRSERAQKYTGLVVRNADNGLVEPTIGWALDYNLSDPANAAFAGPFRAVALGFTSFQNRVVRLSFLTNQLMLALNSPEMGKRTKLDALAAEIYKANDTDPAQFLKTPEELAAEQQAAMEAEAAMQAQSGAGPLDEARAVESQAKAQATQAQAQAVVSDAESRRAEAEARVQEQLARAGLTEAQAERERAATALELAGAGETTGKSGGKAGQA